MPFEKQFASSLTITTRKCLLKNNLDDLAIGILAVINIRPENAKASARYEEAACV
jgi:hypothetical protein